MSKMSTRKTLREATTEETRPEELEYSESEEVDRHSPPHTSGQTNMTKDLMTILEFMEKKEICKEEKRLTEEQRRREEDQRKEELRERKYQEDADRQEKRLLELLDSKEKIHYEHQRRMLEKNKNLKAIPTWKDSDKPADYLRRFEQVMLCNEEPKDQWARLLSINLSGKASTVFNTRIPTAQQDDYDVVKTVLLDAFGDTVDLARQQWWTMRKETEESFQACMIHFEEKFRRGMEGCTTILDLVSILSMTKFLSILTPECCTYVLGRNPKDGIAAAHLAEEFYRINPWKSRSGHIAHMRGKTLTIREAVARGKIGGPTGQNMLPAMADNNSLKGISPGQTATQQTIQRYLLVTDVGRKGTRSLTAPRRSEGYLLPNQRETPFMLQER